MTTVDERIYAMFAVSGAIASGRRQGSALDEIAAQARSIASADASAILELTGQERFRIVGSDCLSDEYRRTLHDWPTQLSPGHGPSGLAVSGGKPVVASDFQEDPRFTEWSSMPLRDKWRSLAALPLIVDGTILGTIVLYRTSPHHWAEEEIDLLSFVAEHAAVAVRTAQLIAEQQRQVLALERLVGGLQAQAHEHANRLHALAGLLVLDDPNAALTFIQELTSAHLYDRVALGDADASSAVIALLRVEVLLARHRSIDLRVDVPKVLSPTPLTDAQAVTIVGNLLDNALEAVADMPRHRRRVDLTISQSGQKMVVRVQDRGPGIAADMDPFEAGRSGKAGHDGLGLALTKEAVIAAYGDIRIDRLPDGTAVEVSVPLLETPEGEPAPAPVDHQFRMLEGIDALKRD
jgi:GAF domain-containing protein